MTNYVFKKNLRAIRYGNNVCEINAAYCTYCNENMTLCNLKAPASCASLQPHACPHMREDNTPDGVMAPMFGIGDRVTTIHADKDQSMGPAEIVMMVAHKDQPYVICRWLKYDERDTPCYRPVAVSDLVHWVEKKEPVETPVTQLRALHTELNRHITDPTRLPMQIYLQKLIDILLSERIDGDKP